MTIPIYVYRCDHCGHQFEELRKIGDPNPPCSKVLMRTESTQADGPPEEHDWACGHDTQKVIVGSNFHLKGSGWASDGYS